MASSTEPVVVETRDPADPSVVIARVPYLDHRAVEAAVVRGNAIQHDWEGSPGDRLAALDRLASGIGAAAEEFAVLIAREVGKPITEARAEVDRSIKILRYYAQLALDPVGEVYPDISGNGEASVRRSALGLVLAITPWNFPLAIPVWKLAPALAYGNSVLLRPSSLAVGTAARLTAATEGILPPDVLQLIPAEPIHIAPLLTDRRVAGVTFTGSTAVGQEIAATVMRRGGNIQAEMGGQNVSIVLDDADLQSTAISVARAAMSYAGQKCTATGRVVVLRAIEDDFREALLHQIKALDVGPPLSESTVVGPLISESAREEVATAVTNAVASGAELLMGGEVVDARGWYYRPTVLRTTAAHEFARTETFGPAMALITAADVDEAVGIANSTAYGLVAAVYGADALRAESIALKIDAGLLRVNAPTTGVDYHMPFGGARKSAVGPPEQGRAARDFFTRSRTLIRRSA